MNKYKNINLTESDITKLYKEFMLCNASKSIDNTNQYENNDLPFQKCNEPVSEYIIKIRLQCYKKDNSMTDKYIINSIYKGLRNDIKAEINLDHYSTIDNFTNEAIKIESSLKYLNKCSTFNTSNDVVLDTMHNLNNKIDELIYYNSLDKNYINNITYNDQDNYFGNNYDNNYIDNDYNENYEHFHSDNYNEPIYDTFENYEQCNYITKQPYQTCINNTSDRYPNNIINPDNPNDNNPVNFESNLVLVKPKRNKNINLIFTYVKINKTKIKCLVDSGSGCTFINSNICNKLKLKINLYNGPEYGGVNGSKLEIIGRVKLILGLPGDYQSKVSLNALVAKNINHSIILGNDFNFKSGAIINYENCQVEFQNKNICANINLMKNTSNVIESEYVLDQIALHNLFENIVKPSIIHKSTTLNHVLEIEIYKNFDYTQNILSECTINNTVLPDNLSFDLNKNNLQVVLFNKNNFKDIMYNETCSLNKIEKSQKTIPTITATEYLDKLNIIPFKNVSKKINIIKQHRLTFQIVYFKYLLLYLSLLFLSLSMIQFYIENTKYDYITGLTFNYYNFDNLKSIFDIQNYFILKTIKLYLKYKELILYNGLVKLIRLE